MTKGVLKVYLAGPLFNEIELERNREFGRFLKDLGFQVYLPQEDGSIAFNRIKSGEDRSGVRKEVFLNDVEEVKKCGLIIVILDGRVPDEGVCVEVGMAYILGKKCIGYKTDTRKLDEYGDNLMLEGCLEKIVNSREELKDFLIKLL